MAEQAVERAVAAATAYDVERAVATALVIRGSITEEQRDCIAAGADEARAS